MSYIDKPTLRQCECRAASRHAKYLREVSWTALTSLVGVQRRKNEVQAVFRIEISSSFPHSSKTDVLDRPSRWANRSRVFEQ